MPAAISPARRVAPYAGAALVLALIAAVARASSWRKPLGTDTGQYLYVADVLLDGGTPYVDAANNKGPVTYLLFVVIRLLGGTSMTAVRLSLLAFAVLAAIFLGLWVARYAGRGAGVLAAVTFAVLSGVFGFQGDDPNTEQYGVAFMTAALWAATRPGARWALGAGALVAAAGLVNPSLGIAAPFVAFELWRAQPPERRAGLRRFALGVGGGVLLMLPFAVWLLAAGAFDEFYDSVVRYVYRAADFSIASTYVPGTINPLGGTGAFNIPIKLLWIWSLAGALVACTDARLRRPALVGIGWVALAWLRVKVAHYEFPHHYYPALPGLVIGLALGVARVWDLLPSPRVALRVAVAVALLAFPVWKFVVAPERDLLQVDAGKRWGFENFALAYPVASFLRANTEPDDRILVVGTDPEVYWLADRRAMTPFFDIFGLLLAEGAPERRRADFRRSPPEAIVAMPKAELSDPDLDAFLNDMGEEYPPAFEVRGARVWLRKR